MCSAVCNQVAGIDYVRERLQQRKLTFLVGKSARSLAIECFGIDTTADEARLAVLHPSQVRSIVRLIERRLPERPLNRPPLFTTLSPLVLNELQPDQVALVTHWGRRVTPIKNTTQFSARSQLYTLGALWLNNLRDTDDDSEPMLIPREAP